ncbi:protein kinase 1 [Helicoverpa armigera multiple nucleopolyhedrovirus]|nr:protein kinase 1 [Helicoverpa armigera multiple nucleopolyhedrovirus]
MVLDRPLTMDKTVIELTEFLSQCEKKPEYKLFDGKWSTVSVIEHKITQKLFVKKKIKMDHYNAIESLVHSLLGEERHFIKMYFSVTTLKHHILIMDYIKGGDLFDLFKKKERLSTLEVKLIVRQIVEGLNMLHYHNIVHNDIKLENILYDRFMQIHIADYGLSRIVGQKTCMDGTQDYYSPEKIKGDNYQIHFDWWALGILVSELIAGKSPFKTDFDEKVSLEILAGRQQKKLTFTSDMDKNAQTFITYLLKYNINYRLINYNEIIRHNFLL